MQHTVLPTGRVIPEHGCDQLPGEREDTNPDAGDRDSLQELVKLMVCESCTDENVKDKRKNLSVSVDTLVHIHTHKYKHTDPGGDEVLPCVQLQVKTYDCSKDHEGPDCQLQQVTQPGPQLGV